VRPAATDVVLLCGGRGSRLGALTTDTPKPLLPVGGRPFLLHLLLHLKTEGFSRFILAAHYLPDRFQEFVSNFSSQMDLQLIIEPEPLGTGGALRHAAGAVRSPHFLAVNGDTWISQSLEPVMAQHEREGRVFTAVAAEADRVEESKARKGVWRIGPGGEFLSFGDSEITSGAASASRSHTEKKATQRLHLVRPPLAAATTRGWVNAGVYLLDREFVASWPAGSYSLEASFNRLLAGKKAGVFCSKGTLLDIGTPEVYAQADKAVDCLR